MESTFLPQGIKNLWRNLNDVRPRAIPFGKYLAMMKVLCRNSQIILGVDLAQEHSRHNGRVYSGNF